MSAGDTLAIEKCLVLPPLGIRRSNGHYPQAYYNGRTFVGWPEGPGGKFTNNNPPVKKFLNGTSTPCPPVSPAYHLGSESPLKTEKIIKLQNPENPNKTLKFSLLQLCSKFGRNASKIWSFCSTFQKPKPKYITEPPYPYKKPCFFLPKCCSDNTPHSNLIHTF